MDLTKVCWLIFASAVILLLQSTAPVAAGDIVHDDELTPKKPGCENEFVLVLLL